MKVKATQEIVQVTERKNEHLLISNGTRTWECEPGELTWASKAEMQAAGLMGVPGDGRRT